MTPASSRRIGIGDRIAEGLLWRLKRLGIHVRPLVTVLEGGTPVDLVPEANEFVFSEITEANIRELVELEPETIAERH